MPTPEETYAALALLRDAPKGDSGAVDSAWQTVWARLGELAKIVAKGSDPEQDDVRQEAFIKVQRYVEGMTAQTAAKAGAWLKRILENVGVDIHRARKWDRLVSIDVARRADGKPYLETLSAEPSEPAEPLDGGELDEYMHALEDMLWRFLEAQSLRRSAINRAYRNAMIAYRVVVEKASTSEIRDAMEGSEAETKLNTIQQWAGRGRTRVMIPALEWWIPGLTQDSSLRNYAEALLELMVSKARADAGKGRPDRRKSVSDSPPVSEAEHCASDQYDDEADDD